MRRLHTILTMGLVLALGATLVAWPGAQTPAGDQYLGIWSGGWEAGSGGSGGFELTIEKGKDGGLAGKVSVTGEPTYTATLKTLTITGGKMSGKYDFTPDPSLEVTLEATFESSSAKGTWYVRPGSGGADVASGTWSVKKK
jgi:hypothetical protein